MIDNGFITHDYYQYARRFRVDPEGNGDFATIGEACIEAANLATANTPVEIEVNPSFKYRESFDIPAFTRVRSGVTGFGTIGGSGLNYPAIELPAGHLATDDYLISIGENSALEGFEIPIQVSDVATVANDSTIIKIVGQNALVESVSILSKGFTYAGVSRLTGIVAENPSLIGTWSTAVNNCHITIKGSNTYGVISAQRLLLYNTVFYQEFNTVVEVTLSNVHYLMDTHLVDLPAIESSTHILVFNNSASGTVVFKNTRCPRDKISSTSTLLNQGIIQMHPDLWQLGVVTEYGELTPDVTGQFGADIRTATDYVVGRSDSEIWVDASAGAVNIYLPQITSTFDKRRYTIKKIDTTGNSVTIIPFGTNKIDLVATHVISTSMSSINVQSEFIIGTADVWWIV